MLQCSAVEIATVTMQTSDSFSRKLYTAVFGCDSPAELHRPLVGCHIPPLMKGLVSQSSSIAIWESATPDSLS